MKGFSPALGEESTKGVTVSVRQVVKQLHSRGDWRSAVRMCTLGARSTRLLHTVLFMTHQMIPCTATANKFLDETASRTSQPALEYLRDDRKDGGDKRLLHSSEIVAEGLRFSGMTRRWIDGLRAIEELRSDEYVMNVLQEDIRKSPARRLPIADPFCGALRRLNKGAAFVDQQVSLLCGVAQIQACFEQTHTNVEASEEFRGLIADLAPSMSWEQAAAVITASGSVASPLPLILAGRCPAVARATSVLASVSGGRLTPTLAKPLLRQSHRWEDAMGVLALCCPNQWTPADASQLLTLLQRSKQTPALEVVNSLLRESADSIIPALKCEDLAEARLICQSIGSLKGDVPASVKDSVAELLKAASHSRDWLSALAVYRTVRNSSATDGLLVNVVSSASNRESLQKLTECLLRECLEDAGEQEAVKVHEMLRAVCARRMLGPDVCAQLSRGIPTSRLPHEMVLSQEAAVSLLRRSDVADCGAVPLVGDALEYAAASFPMTVARRIVMNPLGEAEVTKVVVEQVTKGLLERCEDWELAVQWSAWCTQHCLKFGDQRGLLVHCMMREAPDAAAAAMVALEREAVANNQPRVPVAASAVIEVAAAELTNSGHVDVSTAAELAVLVELLVSATRRGENVLEPARLLDECCTGASSESRSTRVSTPPVLCAEADVPLVRLLLPRTMSLRDASQLVEGSTLLKQSQVSCSAGAVERAAKHVLMRSTTTWDAAITAAVVCKVHSGCYSNSVMQLVGSVFQRDAPPKVPAYALMEEYKTFALVPSKAVNAMLLDSCGDGLPVGSTTAADVSEGPVPGHV